MNWVNLAVALVVIGCVVILMVIYHLAGKDNDTW